MIELKSVEKEYGINGHSQQVLNGITITLEKGNIYALVGPSGSGKSTLLNIIGGLIHPTKGEVKIGDKNITEFNSNQLAELRTNDIGFIFQDFNLIPFLNVKENILFSLRLKGE
ncbi:ABC transporter ATP-binding protein, partial [Enterococcus faecalis]|nr:ABC transporter ATP-binding protein [Enterococcus faecalis]